MTNPARARASQRCMGCSWIQLQGRMPLSMKGDEFWRVSVRNLKGSQHNNGAHMNMGLAEVAHTCQHSGRGADGARDHRGRALEGARLQHDAAAAAVNRGHEAKRGHCAVLPRHQEPCTLDPVSHAEPALYAMGSNPLF